ncbi:MAG TPA: hypothetical protein VIJ25_09690 [Methylococcales bacterium]
MNLPTYQFIHTQKIVRHTGMDCRYPDHMDVISACHPWLLDSGNPCRNDALIWYSVFAITQISSRLSFFTTK